MAKTLLHATWHMTTVAFLTVGTALPLARSVLPGEAARAVAVVAAAATTGFAATAVGFGKAAQSLELYCVTPVRWCSTPPRRSPGGELTDALDRSPVK